MDHEQLEESLSLYALGTLEPESAGEVHAHLATGCARCSALLRQYQGTATMLPYALAPQAPPANLKSRIMAAISGRSAPAEMPLAKPDVSSAKTAPAELSPAKPEARRHPFSSQTRRTWWSSPALAAALGGLLVGIGASLYYLYDTVEAERAASVGNQMALTKANSKIADLERQVEDRQKSLAKAADELNRTILALRTTHELLARHQEQIEVLQALTGRLPKATAKYDPKVAEGEDLLRILSSPTAKMADLHGTDMAKGAYALVFVEPDTRRGYFYANNLPELPAGKMYQLWIITDKPVSAGVFSIDRGRKGRVMMRDVPAITSIKQFAVSMEPAGGRPQPSGSIYLAGSM